MANKFSILCPSYNHENYVDSFITSVLKQTYENFELIIVDDNSADKTTKLIEKYSDNRIKLIKQPYNMGINSTINTAFKNSNGEYVVIIASDDMIKPNFLEYIKDYMDKNTNINVFYQSLQHMNAKGEILESFFINNDDDKYVMLKNMFIFENVLASPGIIIRRKAFENIYPLQASLCQFQDYVMHIELLLKNEIYKEKLPLVIYRLPSNVSGISANNFAKEKREEIETQVLMDTYLKIDSVDLLNKIFKEEVLKIGIPTKETIPYFLARIALTSPRDERKKWGYKTIMNFLSSQENFDLLHNLYGFEFKNYINLVNCFEKSQANFANQYTFLEKIFSVKNEKSNNKKYKVITIFGIKIKFKTNGKKK